MTTEPSAHAAPACATPLGGAAAEHVERLQADRGGDRAAAWLRIAAAALAALGGAWLWSVSPGSYLLRGVAAVSLVFAWLWVRIQLRVLQARAPSEDYLEIGAHHLVLAHAGSARSLALVDVREVAIDHERLRVLVTLTSGEQLPIEPRYRGLGLAELAERLHRAARTAREGADA